MTLPVAGYKRVYRREFRRRLRTALSASFKLGRHQHVLSDMFARRLVEHLDRFGTPDLRPIFPPIFGRVLGFQSGLMRPVFP